MAWPIAVLIAIVATLASLRDPAWVGGLTSGMRPWAVDRDGTPFRWTNGHATFYVPGDVRAFVVPLRAGVPRPEGKTVTASVSVDDRWMATRALEQPDRWVRLELAMPGPAARRFRRVEIRVIGVIPDRNLGVQVGRVELLERGARR